MKKWKFALASLTGLCAMPFAIMTSCTKNESPMLNYKWMINKGNFTYEIISDTYGEDFKIKITANSGYGIYVEQSTLYIGRTQSNFELHDGILTIPANEIGKKTIKINIVSVLTPESISLTYGSEGKTDPITVYSDHSTYSGFHTTVVPTAASGSVVCKSSFPNVAKFENNILYPLAIGEVDIYLESVGYGTNIRSNMIHVTVAPTADTDTISDTNVPEKVDCVVGKNNVGFLFRGFKADFDMKQRLVTPKIVLPAEDESKPSVSITNIENDSFNKSTFDVYVEYNRNDYDSQDHPFNIQFTIAQVQEPIVSKPLIMSHNAFFKTVEVSDVTPTSELVNLSEIEVKGFKTNFKFDPNGYDKIKFVSSANNWTIISSQINVVQATTDETIFNTKFYVDGELENGPLTFGIYLDETFIRDLTVQINVGDTVWIVDVECDFINGDKPTLTVRTCKTNFDFRVPGETGADEKPLLTVGWQSDSPVPAPSETIVEHRDPPETDNDDFYYFKVTFNWSEKIDVTKLENFYVITLDVFVDGQPVENMLGFISFLLPNIKPYRLITDLVKTDNQQKIYIHDFIFSGNFAGDSLEYVFQSNDGLPIPTIRSSFDCTGITYADGYYVESLELDWGQQVVDLSSPKHFTIEIKDATTGDTYLSPIEFSLRAPDENEYWRIVPKAEGAKIDVIKNTSEQIQFKVTNIEQGHEFIGFSARQHYKQNTDGITYDWDETKHEGLITIDIPGPSLSGYSYYFENCQIDALAIFRDISNDENYYVQNEDFITSEGFGGEYDAIKNDSFVDVKASKRYHIRPNLANWPIKHWAGDYEKVLMFQIGNVDETILSGDVVGFNPDYAYVFFNQKELECDVYNYGAYTCIQAKLESSSLEEFKAGQLDILMQPILDQNNVKFNTTIV